MELVKSLTVDAAPAITELFRFMLITILQLIKKGLLLFPVNLVIFVIIVVFIFHKVVRMVTPKEKFNQVYRPLQHS